MATQPAALATIPAPEGLDRRISVNQLQARRSAVVELMQSAMREGVDFGTIPGTPKPTLFKPGAEKVCSLFQLAPRVHVIDLSTPDSIRYQVRVELCSTSGVFLGEGIGTASSAESKYQWRGAVCDEEYQSVPEDRRRIAYKRSRDGFYTIAQVRTEPEDADNTIIKMAKKRALVDAVLTVTAASDIFAQDVEDLDAPPQDDATNGQAAAAAAGAGASGYNEPGNQRRPPQTARTSTTSTVRSTGQPARQAAPAQQQRPAAQGTARMISGPQQNRFYAIATGAGKTSDQVKQYLFATFGIEHSRDLKMSDYDRACEWAAQRGAPAVPQVQPDPADYVDDEQLEPEGYQGQF